MSRSSESDRVAGFLGLCCIIAAPFTGGASLAGLSVAGAIGFLGRCRDSSSDSGKNSRQGSSGRTGSMFFPYEPYNPAVLSGPSRTFLPDHDLRPTKLVPRPLSLDSGVSRSFSSGCDPSPIESAPMLPLPSLSFDLPVRVHQTDYSNLFEAPKPLHLDPPPSLIPAGDGVSLGRTCWSIRSPAEIQDSVCPPTTLPKVDSLGPWRW